MRKNTRRNLVVPLLALVFLAGVYFLITWNDQQLAAQNRYLNSTIAIESWTDSNIQREFLDLTLAGPRATEYTYISSPQLWQGEFNSFAVLWQQELAADTSLDIWVRTGDGKSWSDWLYIWPDDDELANRQADDNDAPILAGAYNQVSDLLPLITRHDRLQYRLKMSSKRSGLSPKLERLKFNLINSPTKQLTAFAVFKNRILSLAQADGFRIISRSEWGADESLRVFKTDNPIAITEEISAEQEQQFAAELKIVRKVTHDAGGQRLSWPLTYPEKVTKIVVHHTAGLQNPADSFAYLRSLYYWHAITKGWGDLGYNYIIDKDGNVFE